MIALDRLRVRCTVLRHLAAHLMKDKASLRWHDRISRYAHQLGGIYVQLEGSTLWLMVTYPNVVKELADVERELNKVEEYIMDLKHRPVS